MLSPFEKGGEHSEGDLSNKISPNPSLLKRGTESLGNGRLTFTQNG
jgi:hypothetical protein